METLYKTVQQSGFSDTKLSDFKNKYHVFPLSNNTDETVSVNLEGPSRNEQTSLAYIYCYR